VALLPVILFLGSTAAASAGVDGQPQARSAASLGAAGAVDKTVQDRTGQNRTG